MGTDPAETVAPRPGKSSPLARILVVVDEPSMLALMDRVLGEAYECEFVGSAAEARRQLDAGSFEIAICNFESAGGSRLGLAGEIVDEHPQTATIVLMTGGDDPKAARRAFAHGVYGYLVEPFLPGQLLITVMNTLRRRNLEIAADVQSRNLEDRRQTIIDMVPIGIFAKDVSGHYVLSNDTADLMAGMEPGGLVGKTDEAFLAGEELEIGEASFDRVLQEGVPHERVDTLEIGGVTRTFKSIRFPLLGEYGEINAVGGVSVDITAEREALRLRDELTATLKQAIENLSLSRQETIEGLAKAIDLHDSSTGEHVDRMAPVASLLATLIGLDPERVLLLRAAAPMHDVGKIGIPAELLRKPGSLSAEERSEMEHHTVIGHEIFSHFASDLSRTAASIALTHHERFDGSGYPFGLAGEEIPLEGRITAVADVFDALLSDRSYRDAMPVGEAVGVMKEGSGSQFDPAIVDALLGNLDDALAVRG